jgi:hypothetical protein
MRGRIILPAQALLFTAILGLCGCAAYWAVSGGKHRSNGPGAYAFQEPAGWMVFKKGGTTVFSKHGAEFDLIGIEGRDISKIRSDTAPQPRPGMTPLEIGDIIILDCQASRKVFDVEVLNESVVTLVGKQAVKIELRYKISGDLVKRAVSHAFVAGTRYFEITYSALETYYFDAGLDDYYTVVESFSLR